MSALDDWVVAVCAELGLPPDAVPVSTVLDVARDVAHQVVRPGAPVTAYLLGLAAAHGTDPALAAERISALAANWPQPTAAPSQTIAPEHT